MINNVITTVLFLLFTNLRAQEISMYFPQFSGKNYDFIIFQGGQQKTIYQGVIPKDGRFILHIPIEYTPYKGMSRWLITGTKEGGGLDMFIPGVDYSVSCTSIKPNNNNIIYNNNDYIRDLHNLQQEQENILNRYELMRQVTKLYSKSDNNYNIFNQEFQTQKKKYEKFQEKLIDKSDYISHFIQIINITRGIGTQLLETQNDKAENINNYIVHKLKWRELYTSGYWNDLIDFWINIHTRVINDPKRFGEDLKKILSKIKLEQINYDFKERLKNNITLNNNSYIKILTSLE